MSVVCKIRHAVSALRHTDIGGGAMREKFWTVIGSIAGVLGVIFAVWFFFQGRSDQSKKLEIELIARSVLVDENVSRAKQRIEILYDGRKIPNYVILQFRVANSGGQPIRSNDYEEPFRLNFANVAEVLSIEQVSSNPKQLQVVSSVASQSSVVFPTVLLNPSDWFILEVGIAPESGKNLTIEPYGRIAGVKQIDFRESIAPPKKESIFPAWVSAIFQVIIVIALVSPSVIAAYSGWKNISPKQTSFLKGNYQERK
jgi:hypothetical protein